MVSMCGSQPADRQPGHSGASEEGPVIGVLLHLVQLSLSSALQICTVDIHFLPEAILFSVQKQAILPNNVRHWGAVLALVQVMEFRHHLRNMQDASQVMPERKKHTASEVAMLSVREETQM